MEEERSMFENIDIDVEKVKELVTKLVSEDTVQDLREGASLVMRAKDVFMKVLCRVLGWAEWVADGARSVPDEIEEKAVEEIISNPKSYMK